MFIHTYALSDILDIMSIIEIDITEITFADGVELNWIRYMKTFYVPFLLSEIFLVSEI